MRARVLERVRSPLADADLSLPDPVDDQVRVRLTASGVCHSDLHALDGDWTVPLPLVLGHEGAGVVEAVGPLVRDVTVGDHVVLSWFAPCRRCRHCASGQAWLCTGTRALEHPSVLDGVHAFLGLGTFAETTVVPESAVVAIDPAVPAEIAALIGCSVATGVGAVLNTAGVRAGESAIVVGCGGVGQAIVLGMPAECVRVAIDPFDLADQGKRVVGCNYGSSVPAVDFPRLARLYLAGRLPLEALVGRRRPLDEADAALDDLRDAVGLRTVLVP